MHFMVLVMGGEKRQAGILPGERILTDIGEYNKELLKSGAMFGGEVLQPSSTGARIRFSHGQTSVMKGPFDKPQELLAGFWHLEAESLDEAIELVARMPNPEYLAGEVEIRQVLEMEDFAPLFSWME